MERKIRKPTQKRALEKFNRIVDAAFKLFNEKGYYNTTTADIAKEAEVATGSVYAYFEDKKDIYIQVIDKINSNFDYPTHDFWTENSSKHIEDPEIGRTIFSTFLKLMISSHNFSKTFHDELQALSLLDKDICKVNREYDDIRIQKIKDIFEILAIPFKTEEDCEIFLHYSNLLVDDVCHKVLYDDTVKNMDLYINKCVDMLYKLFETTTTYKK